MPKREFLTDEDVEREIARLNASPAVKLAERENALKYQRRKRLYNLRLLEKRGIELARAGITFDNIEVMIAEAEREGVKDEDSIHG